MAQPIWNLPDAAQSHDSIHSAAEVSITLEHQPGPGRTLNRFDTWLGRGLERAVRKIRAKPAPPELSIIPRIFTATGPAGPPLEFEPITRIVTAESETVDEQRGLGRTLNRVDTWLGRKLERTFGRVVAVLFPTPEALRRRIVGILDEHISSLAFEDLKETWKAWDDDQRYSHKREPFSSEEVNTLSQSGWRTLDIDLQARVNRYRYMQNHQANYRHEAMLQLPTNVQEDLRKNCASLVKHCRTLQPGRLRSALEGIDALAFEYTVLRDIFKEQTGWERMHAFVAPSRYSRMHEAAALEAQATKALICVEEVEINGIGTELHHSERWQKCEKWPLLLERMRNPQVAFLAVRHWERLVDSETLINDVCDVALGLPQEAVEWALIDRHALDYFPRAGHAQVQELVLRNPHLLPGLLLEMLDHLRPAWEPDILDAIESGFQFKSLGDLRSFASLHTSVIRVAANLNVQDVSRSNASFAASLLAASLQVIRSALLSIVATFISSLPIVNAQMVSEALAKAKGLPTEDLPSISFRDKKLELGKEWEDMHVKPSEVFLLILSRISQYACCALAGLVSDKATIYCSKGRSTRIYFDPVVGPDFVIYDKSHSHRKPETLQRSLLFVNNGAPKLVYLAYKPGQSINGSTFLGIQSPKCSKKKKLLAVAVYSQRKSFDYFLIEDGAEVPFFQPNKDSTVAVEKYFIPIFDCSPNDDSRNDVSTWYRWEPFDEYNQRTCTWVVNLSSFFFGYLPMCAY